MHLKKWPGRMHNVVLLSHRKFTTLHFKCYIIKIKLLDQLMCTNLCNEDADDNAELVEGAQGSS